MMTLRSSRASPPLHNNPHQPLRGRAGGAGALGWDTPPFSHLPAGERRHGHRAGPGWGAGRRSPAPLVARGLPRAAASPQRPPAGKRRKWRIHVLLWFCLFVFFYSKGWAPFESLARSSLRDWPAPSRGEAACPWAGRVGPAACPSSPPSEVYKSCGGLRRRWRTKQQ